ncbi:MAG: hypothetical protein ACI4SO_03740 [Muribaculaceae bacterium]
MICLKDSIFLEKGKTEKEKFLDCFRYVCRDFKVDGDNAEALSLIFDWCMRKNNSRLKLHKGLYIYGNVGCGKTTLMKGVLEFISRYWLLDAESVTAYYETAVEVCLEFADRGNVPYYVGIDDIGVESSPTLYNGNRVDVIAKFFTGIKGRLPHIVTCGIDFKEIWDKYSTPVFDRIGHNFNIVRLGGSTRRDSSEIWKMVGYGEK